MGKKKVSKVKYTPYQSAFRYTGSNYATPYSFGSSGIDNGILKTSATLAPGLQSASDTASAGLTPNLAFLQQDPNQRIAFIDGGNDPLYNILSERIRRAEADALGRAKVNAQGTGNSNSTAYGSAMGTILNDSLLRKNSTLLDALNFGNENARANIGTNLGAIGTFANLANPAGAAANSNSLAAYSAQDQAASNNAGNQLQANMANAAAQNAQNMLEQQKKSSMLGNLVNLGGTLLGSAFGGPVGGAIGSKLAGAFSGGGGASGSIGGSLLSGGGGLGELSSFGFA